jgi:superfamily II DNA or RNA helicase
MFTQQLFTTWDDQTAAIAIDKVRTQQITLRPYQADAVDGAFREWEKVRSTLINLATGMGKSVCFAEVMRRWDVKRHGRILLIAHRTELIFQAVGHAKRAGLTSGIEMAGRYASAADDVVIASVQTLNASTNCKTCFGEGCDWCTDGRAKRFTRFNPKDFGLITIDEGHHAVATSYRNVLTWFGQNPNQKTLLVTATPKRADKKGLNNICDSVAYTATLRDGIDGGWLVPILQKFVTVEGLDLSKVKATKGDLAQGELEDAFLGTDEDEERMLHSVVKPALMEARGRKMLVFAAGKEHAEKLAAAFNANGVEAGVVTDDTDMVERATLVDRYSNGDLQVLVNCMVFCEGFDAPRTAVVANCRSTKSESLYLQIIGRATRPLAGVVDGPATAELRKQAIADSEKPFCTILDFCGNSGNHKLVSVADVLAGDRVDPIDLKKAVEMAKQSGEAVDMDELLEKLQKKRQAREERKERERLKRLMTNTKADHADYTAVDVDLFGGVPFQANVQTGETPITPNQQRFLTRLGVSKAQSQTMSKRQASAVIAKSYGKIQSDWVGKFNQATSTAELLQVGLQIATRKESDYMLKNADLQERLRREYKARQKQLQTQGK